MAARDWVFGFRCFESTWFCPLQGSKYPRWYYVGSQCLNPITDSASYHSVTDSAAAPQRKYRNGKAGNLQILGEHWAGMDDFYTVFLMPFESQYIVMISLFETKDGKTFHAKDRKYKKKTEK